MIQTYIIWKSVEDRNVSDVNDVAGLFKGTYEEADAVIERLNKADPSVKEGFLGRVRIGYWRSEPNWLTPSAIKELEECLA